MKIEDLLKARYKVTGPYPNSPYAVGDLVEISDSGTTFHCTSTTIYDSFRDDMVECVNYFNIDKLKDFPNLFKEIPWHEDRKPEDMPEYLKIKERVWHVKEWNRYLGSWVLTNYIDNKEETEAFLSIDWHFYSKQSIPSTEVEYNEYRLLNP